MNKTVTMYNIMILASLWLFPLFGAFVFIFIIPAWISGVFWIISEGSKIEDSKTFFRSNFKKVILFAYLSILIGIAAEFLINWFVLELHLKISDYGDEWYKTVPAVLIAGGLTFVFAKFVIFKKLEKEQSTKIALALALSTAPYWLMIPTGLFFHH